MAESGGSANQSGISFQNSLAAYFVADMLSAVERPAAKTITSVRVEAREAVDDIVVTHADGHRFFFQVKENLEPRGDTWQTLWAHFIEQFLKDDFRRIDPDKSFKLTSDWLEADRLYLAVESDSGPWPQWREALARTKSESSLEAWLKTLNADQTQFWHQRVAPLLGALSSKDLWPFIRCLDCEIRTRSTLESDSERCLPAARNAHGPLTAANVLAHIVSRLPEDASRRVELRADELRHWLHAEHQVQLASAPPVAELRKAVYKCSGVLRSQRARFGEGGDDGNRHRVRPVVGEIVQWLCPDIPKESDASPHGPVGGVEETSPISRQGQNNIAVLLDHPGTGKTVVLRDILERLEANQIDVLAIKADRQLADLSQGRRIHECRGVDLPASVDDVVVWLAQASPNDKPVVVLLDQVDALSLSMARDSSALEAVTALVAQLNGTPGVKVLLACRTFDLNTTPALRSLDIKQRFALGRLDEGEVTALLADAEVNSSVLSQVTKDLLRTPLHLDLFLRAIEGQGGEGVSRPAIGDARAVRSLQDLYQLIWARVVSSPEPRIPAVERVEVLRSLVRAMDEDQRTTVRKSVLQKPASQHLAEAAQYLEHEGLLQSEGDNWVFLHQTFFDYAFARFFVEDGRDLPQEVFDSPQGLAQRPLLTHILGYMRSTDSVLYGQTLWRLGIGTFFEIQQLRKHLQILLREWFGALQAPTGEEWLFTRRLMFTPSRRDSFLGVASSNRDWFEKLSHEHIPEWLEKVDRLVQTEEGADDPSLPNILMYLLFRAGDDAVSQLRIVDLLKPYLHRSQASDQRIKYWLAGVRKWHSKEIVGLYGELLDESSDEDGSYHYQLHTMAAQRPIDACEVLRKALELAVRDLPCIGDGDHPMLSSFHFFEGMSARTGEDRIDHRVMYELGEKVPVNFVEASWEFFTTVIHSFDHDHSSNDFVFPIDPFSSSFDIRTSMGSLHSANFGTSFIRALGKAFDRMSQVDNHLLLTWVDRLMAIPLESAQRLAVDALRLSPEESATHSLEFLLGDRRRLELGDQQFETRNLIRDTAPHWDTESCRRLEAVILNHWNLPAYLARGLRDTRHLSWRGLEQLELLRALGKERLSESGRRRLAEWERKFPGYVLTDTPITSMGGFIGSPIDTHVAQRLPDADWLKAMEHYSHGTTHNQFLRGGAEQLSRILEVIASNQPDRFASLFLNKVPLDVDVHYAQAVLRGLADSLASTELVCQVVRRYLNFSGADPHGWLPRTIATILSNRAVDGLPTDMVQVMKSWSGVSPDLASRVVVPEGRPSPNSHPEGSDEDG